MIRRVKAAIGRFILGCERAARDEEYYRRTYGLDFDALSSAEISMLLHGRAIDVSRPPPADRAPRAPWTKIVPGRPA